MSHRDHEELEGIIIASVLSNRDTLVLAADRLTDNDFMVPANQRIWRAIIGQWHAGDVVDAPIVGTILRSWGDDPRDNDWLHSLVHEYQPRESIVSHCDLLKEHSQRRELTKACHRAAEAMKGGANGLEIAVQTLQSACLKLQTGTNQEGLNPYAEDIQAQYDHITAEDDDPRRIGIKTGIHGIDETMKGWFPGEIIVVTAPAGMGKTSLALNITWNVARDHPVFIFSLEMTRSQLANRGLAYFSGITLSRLRGRELYDFEWERLSEARREAKNLKAAMDDSSGLTPFDIYARSASWAIRNKQHPKLIVVDYLQIMRPSEKQGSREREVGSMISDLKHYAKQLGCPILVVSQLSRPTKEQRTKYWEPTLWDLRDSGQIEQDAHAIIAVVRQSYFDRDDNPEAKVLFLKNRDGACPSFRMNWRARTASFCNEGE